MGWPKGKPRGAQPVPAQITSVDSEPAEDNAPVIPADWHPGMLLNVRNNGDALTITLFPEEFDPRKPERALRFTNFSEGQNFVSAWYSRQHHDPRAR